MRAILLATALSLVSIGAMAQTTAPLYSDVIKTCGAEWRERTDKTVKGRDEWNKFRVACVQRKGYKTRAQVRDASFTRVPDAQ